MLFVLIVQFIQSTEMAAIQTLREMREVSKKKRCQAKLQPIISVSTRLSLLIVLSFIYLISCL